MGDAVPGQPAQQAALRVCRLESGAEGERAGPRERMKGCRLCGRRRPSLTGGAGFGSFGARIGGGPEVGRPAALRKRPRWCMSVHRAPTIQVRLQVSI